MRRFLVSEFSKVIRGCIITSVLATACFALILFGIPNEFYVTYNVEIWIIGGQYLGLFYVVLAVVPTCMIMVYEKKNSYIVYTLHRIEKWKYIITKWFITITMAFLIVFLISFLSLLIVLYLFQDVEIGNLLTDQQVVSAYYNGILLIKNPVLYGLLLSIWRGFLAVLYASMSFILSLFISNEFIVLMTPFLYDLLNSYILGMLGYPWLDTATCFDPSRVSVASISKDTFIFPVVGILLVLLFIIIYYKLVKQEKIYKI